MSGNPNIAVIMTDQHRADLTAREGYPLDTTPFLDSLATGGVWFNRAYTTMPVCGPARVSMFTGRYPGASRVRTNHNIQDATYHADLVDVLKSRGYAVGLSGKNHSHLRSADLDHCFTLGHNGGHGEDRTAREKAFDTFLSGLKHRAEIQPTTFPVECQCPWRAVSDAKDWISSLQDRPFFLWLSFPEPHNPYQVPEPYYSMFPPESLPPTRADAGILPEKGFKWEWDLKMFRRAFPDYDAQYPRARSNYHGMLRLIDDQVKRFVEFLDQSGLRDDTILVFVSDHGDFVGEYGLIRKGLELPELLTRIPLLFNGPGIRSDSLPSPAHVSLADIMPTLCEAVGAEIPPGVQGRSLWPLLTGGDYPEREFESACVEQGFGGLHYTADDDLNPSEEGALNEGCSFDCLNSWSQSGQMRMLRKGDWKIVFDMHGRGQLYNLADDPGELENLYGGEATAEIQQELTADLVAWMLRTQDPLPLPRRRYVMKSDERNYLEPYR